MALFFICVHLKDLLNGLTLICQIHYSLLLQLQVDIGLIRSVVPLWLYRVIAPAYVNQ